MRRQITSCLMIVLLFAASSVAQSRSKRQDSAPDTVTDIRQVDFLNFTYRSSLCSQEYGRQGIRKIVPVRNGEFKNKNVYFAVADDRIIYSDVTGDGSEDAIVPVDCGAITANFSRSEVYVYTMQKGRAELLAEISDDDMERDYRGAYADAESYWGTNDLKVRNGNVEIEVLVDGPHASPQYIATLEYRLSGRTLRLNGMPERNLIIESLMR